jgi:hypothetical protein
MAIFRPIMPARIAEAAETAAEVIETIGVKADASHTDLNRREAASLKAQDAAWRERRSRG